MRICSTRFIHLVFILSLATAWILQSESLLAQDPADVYLTGYMQVREAEGYLDKRDYEKAYRKFVDAGKIFTTIAQRWPSFEASKMEQMPNFNGSVKGYPPRRSTGPRTGSGSVGRPPSGGANSDLMNQLLQQ